MIAQTQIARAKHECYAAQMFARSVQHECHASLLVPNMDVMLHRPCEAPFRKLNYMLNQVTSMRDQRLAQVKEGRTIQESHGMHALDAAWYLLFYADKL